MSGAKGSCKGCCCGGCWGPPTDIRAPTIGDNSVFLMSARCCSCIPRFLCATIEETGSYEASSSLLTRFCGGDYSGDPIQFAGSISWNGEVQTINVRLSVVDDVCSITWEIPDLELSGSREIDHTDRVPDYDCKAGQTTEACVNFGGTWEVGGNTLTLAPPSTLDIATNIDCAGCRCMCKCLCMSIASQDSLGNFTLTGSNEVVCAVTTEETFGNCDDSMTETRKVASWTSNGWTVKLTGNSDTPPSTYTVNTGTEQSLGGCSIGDLLRFSDSDAHVIEDDAGAASVTYKWAIDDRKPRRVRWVGMTYEDTSSVTIEIYNWSTTSWDEVGTAAGRTSVVPSSRVIFGTVTDDHVGTGGDEGKVHVRVVMADGTELHTDLLRLTTTECCKLELVPPESVTPTTTLEKLDLSIEGNCPSPFKFWNFEDESGTTWYISIDCSWCGGNCGTVSTACCPRPISRTLFAEVTIDCPTCIESPFTVPLIGDGSIWEGESTHCAAPFTVSLACSGDSWIISVEGTGACSFSGTAATTDCDPFYLTFAGTLGGGLGCCGPFGDPMATPTISITVFE